MASFLLSECLENVFSNLIEHPIEYFSIRSSTKDLYSCTLVSRHWCRISTPFLYAYPLHNYSLDFKLIRTLLSCVPQFEIKQFYTTFQTSSTSPKNIPSTFNYISFMRGLIFDELFWNSKFICNSKNIWLSAHNPEKLSSEQVIRIMKHLIEFMCKHFNNLKM